MTDSADNSAKLTPSGWSLNYQSYLFGLIRRYRVNGNRFDALWATQAGKCAGCDQPLAHPLHRHYPPGLKPEVDHDHRLDIDDPNYMRGLLCRRCNDFLGKIHDNRDNLQRLAAYLDAHGSSLYGL